MISSDGKTRVAKSAASNMSHRLTREWDPRPLLQTIFTPNGRKDKGIDANPASHRVRGVVALMTFSPGELFAYPILAVFG